MGQGFPSFALVFVNGSGVQEGTERPMTVWIGSVEAVGST